MSYKGMQIATVKYDPNLRESWLSGDLPRKWRGKYPEIFDDDDLRIALSQPQFHFYEWVAAIYYNKQGYKVLVEQYIYNAHPRKLAVIKGYLNQEQLDFLRRKNQSGNVQPPDLFIYNASDFFFVEVKSDKDKLQENQKAFFNQIEQRLNTKVILVQLKSNKL